MKKIFALVMSWSLAFWSLLLPNSPAYALAVADKVKCENPDARWTKKLSKAYAKLLVDGQVQLEPLRVQSPLEIVG
jgi:hypothetical protein